jgi:hypothetical protein
MDYSLVCSKTGKKVRERKINGREEGQIKEKERNDGIKKARRVKEREKQRQAGRKKSRMTKKRKDRKKKARKK